jgi:V/A-type H+-transporting ATPase subunit I
MKKVTIITPPEYEGLLLESLGKSQVIHFTKVTGSEYESLKDTSEEAIDYRILYNRVNARYKEILEMVDFDVERQTPRLEDLREFTLDPEGKADDIINEAASLIEEVNGKQERQHVEIDKLVKELQAKLDAEREKFEKEKEKLVGKLADRVLLSSRLESLQALEPDQFKSSFAVGVVKKDLIPKVAEYLRRYEGTYYRTAPISEEESFIFVFGSEETQKWVEALFLVFDIKDVFDTLDSKDILLVLDPAKRAEAIEKYEAELKRQGEEESPGEVPEEEKKIREKIAELESSHRQRISKLRAEYDQKIKENEEKNRKEIADLMGEQSDKIGKIDYYVNLLKMFSNRRVHILRGMVISILQGYTPESKVPKLREAIRKVEDRIGENLFVEVSDLGPEDKHAPTPTLEMPSFLGPSWILTRLRGWPSAEEINPGYISVLIFCFQFGLMFGDIGQGLIYLAIGLALRNRFDRGMMKYLTNLFIPMGIAAIVFGFMYDSIFLVEHAISHWLHEAGIHLPFHYPIMPNPVHEVGELMNLIFMIGAVEIVLGALLGAYNAFKEGNYVGMIGEHGFGMGLYVTGLYLSAGSLFTEGLDIMLMVANWPFKLMIAGMLLSFAEPVLHSVLHGHGLSIESMGEGLGGLLMTFVEGLANMFSFLRIAAFALAHASLAGAGEALGHAIGNGILGLVIMNVIALSFEFVSSSVQSLRLLYYEFMGKFFHGEGVPFRPFRVRQG